MELDKQLEDVWDVLRRLRVRDERLVLDLVAVGRYAAHEETLVEGGLEVLLNALLNRLAFPLPERDEKVHDQLAHRRGGVDKRLGDGGESYSELLHLLVELAEVLGTARHAVDSEDDDLVDESLFALRHEPLVGGAFEIAAAVAVVIESFGKGNPSLCRLGGDETLAHLALGIDGVELLFL